jgi:hypothetical protein
MTDRTDMPIHNLRCTEPGRFAQPPAHEAPDAEILAYLQHSESCAYHARLNEAMDAEMDPLLHAASRNLMVTTPQGRRRRQDRTHAARKPGVLRRVGALGLAAGLALLLWVGFAGLVEQHTTEPLVVVENPSPPAHRPSLTQVREGEREYAARVISNELEGQRTKSGMIYHPDSLSASVAGLPFGSRLRVTNPVNGAVVIVTVVDRGPMDDEINLSASAADALGFDGTATVLVEILYTPPPVAIGP